MADSCRTAPIDGEWKRGAGEEKWDEAVVAISYWRSMGGRHFAFGRTNEIAADNAYPGERHGPFELAVAACLFSQYPTSRLVCDISAFASVSQFHGFGLWMHLEVYVSSCYPCADDLHDHLQVHALRAHLLLCYTLHSCHLPLSASEGRNHHPRAIGPLGFS